MPSDTLPRVVGAVSPGQPARSEAGAAHSKRPPVTQRGNQRSVREKLR